MQQFTEVYPTPVTFNFLNYIVIERGQMLKAKRLLGLPVFTKEVTKEMTRIICSKIPSDNHLIIVSFVNVISPSKPEMS